MSDLPAPDWYTDPDDDRRYRYWDGEAWTEHYSPRRLEGKRLRPLGQLIADAFASIQRHWRVYAVVTLLTATVSVAGSTMGTLMIYDTMDDVLGGELDEIVDRISSPDFDPNSADNREYFSSIEVAFGPGPVMQAVLGLLIITSAPLLSVAALARIAITDLQGRSPTAGAALRGAMARLGRVFGVWLQIIGSIVVVTGVGVVMTLVSPFLLILFVPAVIVLAIASFPLLSLVPVTASIAPRVASLRYTFVLIRGAFWPALGRLLAIVVFVGIVAVAIQLAASSVADIDPAMPLSWVAMLTDLVVRAILSLATVATVVIYHDLGGETAVVER